MEFTIEWLKKENADLKRKLTLFEENKTLQEVVQKDSIYSYLVGRDVNYETLEQSLEKYNKLQDGTKEKSKLEEDIN